MGQIYKDNHETLEALLEQAGSAEGATLLIPDLQRPYVWSPLQVMYLVDSLVRGWPFGSLLLWSVSEEDVAKMPSRPFATAIDRTGGNNGVVPAGRAPATFRMVLDGQQRVQSLLLAFGGDSRGFKLTDRDWHQAVNEKRPRGANPVKHWSMAELCLDLAGLSAEFTRAQSVSAMEFVRVLRWVVRDERQGQSTWKKKSNYDEPLPKAYVEKGRFVRLSRLWSAVKAPGQPSFTLLKTAAAKILDEHGVPEPLRTQVADPLVEIIQTLHAVKQTRVTFLEVARYTGSDMGTPEAYSDAVVSIFTRLNTAGRTLTREEITFAWVKAGWIIAKTGNRGASECFRDLADTLRKNYAINVSIDELVAGVSLLWVVRFNGGRMLANADLLKGDRVRPMACQLSENWTLVESAIKQAAEAVQRRGLAYGTHYQSLNALALIWAWQFIGEAWSARRSLREVERDGWAKIGEDAFAAFADRWFIASQWAGTWGESATTYLESFVGALAKADGEISATDDLGKAGEKWRAALEAMVTPLVKGASDYLETLEVEERELVRAYFLPLWVWHRIDAKRWDASRIPLRIRKTNGTLDVDHIVSVGLCADLGISTEKPDDADDAAPSDGHLRVNALGNCWLLETNFNIAKGKKPAAEFLERVAEFKDKPRDLAQWSDRIGLSDELLRPSKENIAKVSAGISDRTSKIRQELKEFVAGTRTRVDLEGENEDLPAAQPQPRMPAPPDALALA